MCWRFVSDMYASACFGYYFPPEDDAWFVRGFVYQCWLFGLVCIGFLVRFSMICWFFIMIVLFIFFGFFSLIVSLSFDSFLFD
ncbi:hypothetical protein MtrunA17_Chr7g0218931 [Medicago truncatula]|uniref:Transmembrane protein n=1 Tax=Medicago truncatula TaxID=3880 RepID=A0A396GT90_MEDTR|nr:hypothetical protein MtrunA17_Chr7g0218931 [Medicago truncatula]